MEKFSVVPTNLKQNFYPLHTSSSASSNPVFKSFAAGAISGTCSTVIFQPLDLVKTRLQNSISSVGPKFGSIQNIGFLQLITHILQNEQLSGLWKGMTPMASPLPDFHEQRLHQNCLQVLPPIKESLVRCIPGVGIYFSTLHALKSSYISSTGNSSFNPIEAVVLGITARSVSGVCLIPFTVLKTRYESGIYTYNSMLGALNIIYRAEGPRGLCRGLVPTLFRDAPFSGLYLMFYTQTKQALPAEWLEGNAASPLHFTCGVVAGILASLVTQPADVIKTKMQVYPEEFKNLKTAVLYIQKEYGFQGYFKGLVPRMIRRTLMSAMAWTIYERITKVVGLK